MELGAKILDAHGTETETFQMLLDWNRKSRPGSNYEGQVEAVTI